jgi:hypothetical protein
MMSASDRLERRISRGESMRPSDNPGIAGIAGIAWAILGAFPAAAVVALCYRFPIPFHGYRGGPAAVLPSLFAVAFYGLAGGFALLALIGAAAGIAANLLAQREPRRERRLIIAFALAGDLAVAATLAVLDRIIGPWW